MGGVTSGMTTVERRVLRRPIHWSKRPLLIRAIVIRELLELNSTRVGVVRNIENVTARLAPDPVLSSREVRHKKAPHLVCPAVFLELLDLYLVSRCAPGTSRTFPLQREMML